MNSAVQFENTRQRGPVSGLVIAVLGLAAILGAYMLPSGVFSAPSPQPWGVPLALMALMATLIGLMVDDFLFSDKKSVHRFAIEIGLVAIFALISLEIIQYYDTSSEHFSLSINMVEAIRLRVDSPLKATFLLILLSSIPLLISLFAAYFQREKRRWFLRFISVIMALASYAIFMLTLLYAK